MCLTRDPVGPRSIARPLTTLGPWKVHACAATAGAQVPQHLLHQKSSPAPRPAHGTASIIPYHIPRARTPKRRTHLPSLPPSSPLRRASCHVRLPHR